jgi:transcriptional regulator with XRE-family HTH domain
MTNFDSAPSTPPPARFTTPSHVVRARIRRIRKEQGIRIPELAARLSAQGTVITEQQLYNLEGGRRRLHVDYLFAIAAALGVSPLALQTLPTDDEDEVEVTPGVTVTGARFNGWTTGTRPLPGADEARFARFHPYGAPIGRLQGTPDDRVQALANRIAEQAEDAAANAQMLRDDARKFAADIAGLEPSTDTVRSLEALSRRLGIDISLNNRPGGLEHGIDGPE